MKKIIFLFIVLATSLSFISCSDDDNSGTTAKLLREMTSADLGYSIYFDYDNEQRVSKIRETEDGETRTTSIVYTASNIVSTSNDGEVRTYTLDSNGYAVKAVCKDEEYEDIYTYEYENGYISKSTSGDGQIVTYKWQNGNLIEVDWSVGPEKYTYDTNEYKLPVSDNDISGIGFLPLKGTVNRNYLISSEYDNETFSYEFDKDGYLIKMIETDNYSGEKFTYQLNWE